MMLEQRRTELAVLSWMVYRGEWSDVPERYFASGDCRALYRKLTEQYKATGKVENPNYVDELMGVSAEVSDAWFPRNIEPVIDEMARNYRQRRTNQMLLDAQSALARGGNVDGVLDRLSGEVTDIATARVTEEYDHQESISRYCTEMDGKKDDLWGYRSGMDMLDRVLNGFQRKRKYAIGGLKKTGKSRFALWLVARLLRQGLGGIVFSLEMDETDIHNCILCSRTGVDSGVIGTSRLSPGERAVLIEEMAKYREEPLYIDTKRGIDPSYVRAVIRRRKLRQPVDFVMVDYIQRMKIKGLQRREEVEQCAMGLADIFAEEDVVGLELSQLSGRAEERGGKQKAPPIYAMFKESQAVVESADVVIGLDDPDRGNGNWKESESEREVTILQRRGKSDVRFRMRSKLGQCRFYFQS